MSQRPTQVSWHDTIWLLPAFPLLRATNEGEAGAAFRLADLTASQLVHCQGLVATRFGLIRRQVVLDGDPSTRGTGQDDSGTLPVPGSSWNKLAAVSLTLSSSSSATRPCGSAGWTWRPRARPYRAGPLRSPGFRLPASSPSLNPRAIGATGEPSSSSGVV